MKRRFPILAKVIILGIGVSILTSGAAITVSYFNQRSQAEKSYIDNIDNTLDAVDEVFTNPDSQYTQAYVEYLQKVKDYVKTIYDEDPDKRGPEPGESFEHFAAEYASKYPWIYTHDPRMGFVSKEEADIKLAFYTILNLMDNFQMSSDSQSVFIAYTDTDNKMVFLGDSRMDDSSRSPNDYYQIPGYYYQIKESDYFNDTSHIKHRGYVLGGYLTRLTPIYTFKSSNQEKEVIAVVYIQYSLDKVHQEILDVFKKELLILGLSSLILIAIYTAFSYLLFVKNINKLSKASSDIRKRLENKNMNEAVEIPLKSNDEIKILADSLTEMEKAIINYVDIINKETRERERANAELGVASKIQLDSLPNSNYVDKNVSIKAFIKTAKEVGGDFYDYFYLDDHRLVLLISDVSGKGVPASLFMMKGKELIRSILMSHNSLGEAITTVNNILARNNKELLFITSFIGVIDFSKNEIRYINAGHEKPYIISKDKIIKLEGESNIVLGVESGYSYKEESHAFNKGDSIFMFTDGLNESINAKEEEFGYQRIEESLKQTSNLSLDKVVKQINKNLDTFVSSEEQFDDVTILMARFTGPALNLHYEEKDFSVITDIVDSFNDAFSYIDEGKKASVGIIIDELVNNLISYEKREDLIIDVNFEVSKDDLKIVIASNGDDYDPFANHKEKYLDEFHSEIKEGGFGLSLVKNLSKSYSYKYKDGHSIITLVI